MAYYNNQNGGKRFNNKGDNDSYRSPSGFKDGEPVFKDNDPDYKDKPRYDNNRKSYGDKPRYDNNRKPYGDKPRYDGERKPYGDKPRYDGERKPYGDKPRYDGERKPYGDKPRYDNNRKPYGDKPRYDGERKPYGDKPRYDGERKPYGDKPRYDGERKPYGDKPRYDGERKPYGDKPRYDGERKPYGDKPRYDGERKPYGDKPRYDGERKPYGDKPRYDGERKPYGDKPRYDNNRKPYGKKPYEKSYDRGEKDNFKRNDYQADVTQNADDELPYIIMGRNAVREAIKSGRSIDRILVVKDPDGSLREIMSLARDKNIQLRDVDKNKLDEICMPFGHGGKSGNHQGIIAQVPGVEYCEISDILNAAKEKNEKPFVIVLDGIEDPHNLGSIIRSAVCAGAHGVIIPNRRSVSVTAAACKASAGAIEHMKVARVSNISGAIERLKADGLWIAGADMSGTPMSEAKLEGALALIIGSEGSGISRLVRDNCDFMVSIPMYGEMDSLNASVAAAVIMFEKRRKDSLIK